MDVLLALHTHACTHTQSAGAVEHTDGISAEDSTPPMSVLQMTLNNLIVRLQ